MATQQLRTFIELFKKQVEAKGSKKDPVRNALDARTQGYIVNPRVIYREILRKESPFRIQLDQGHITNSDLRNIARDISSQFWLELRKQARKYVTFEVKGTNFPSDFFREDRVTVAFDETKKIVYFRGQKPQSKKNVANHYNAFRTALMAPTIKAAQAISDPLNNFRVYVSPDERYEKAMNEVNARVDAQLELEGLPTVGDSAQGKRARARKKFEQQENFPDYWRGIQIGHVFGAKASGAAGLLENPHNVSHQRGTLARRDKQNLKLAANLAELEPELESLITQTIDADIEGSWERVFGDVNRHAQITLLIPESTLNNLRSGAAASTKATERGGLNDIVRDLNKKENLARLKGSPSIEEEWGRLIYGWITGKKPATRRYKTSARVKTKSKTSIPVYTVPSKRVKFNASRNKEPKDSNTGFDNLQALIDRVNDKMEEQLRKNMGKGNAKQILNWQTGRFGENVKLKNLLPSREKRAITAQVEYWGFPYSRFADRADPLWKPGRDIKGIIGRSIRQILQEEKIANLRRVKVQLHGKH